MSAATYTFPHGIHPPERKFTADAAIERLAWPDEVVVLLSQHIGAPAKALVTKKQQVQRGEPIAEAGGFVSAPMHAPITGTVTRVDRALNPRGEMAPAIIIQRDPDANQEAVWSAPQDLDAMSPDDLVKAVQDAGVVGLGGAAFPTHVKMKVPKGKSIDTVIVNGCECEPYLTTDYRVMIEQSAHIIAGVRLALRITGAKEAVICVENNKPAAIEAMMKAAPGDMPISVRSLETKYPQGAEKMLSKALLNREVPSGGLPSDVGVACFNVATLAQIGELLPRGAGLIERVITVTGGGVTRPGNYMMPLGTPLRQVMEHVGMRDEACAVVNGGPMMGQSMASLDVPLTKGTTGLLVLTRDELLDRHRQVYPCIRCARCVDACPIFLNPSMLGLLARKERYEEMAEHYHLNDCFECGCCAYVCPSNIPLVQYFRIAKAMNRERSASK
ncbi:MAG TPA: electron transport complex subunit RsxC [Candidatus Hydrogenedentes bacterium]|nr:electron transport complex subunit RsxC [Candidatus Hydrogenedentota bacterium]